MSSDAGLNFRYAIPGKRPLNILQTMGGGCAFLDYDGDGNLDILLISQRIALYKGDGKGHFTDVTQAVLPPLAAGWWMGCAVGDYDNDGYEDIYLSAYRGGVLLHNEGGKSFRDVTREAGIAPQPWGSACAFGDYNNDGRLDLYIGNYVKFGPDAVQLCKAPLPPLMKTCPPTVYESEKGVLYGNLGGGRFRDVTRETGADAVHGKVLGVLFLDTNGSERQSIYLANDEVASDLLLNTGRTSGASTGGKGLPVFKNTAEVAGVAYTETGKPFGGMGVDQGDIDGDGKVDLAVGTFSLEDKLLLINQGDNLFVDQSEPLGIARMGLDYLTFGTRLFDVDNDGYLDLMLVNGHVSDNVEKFDPQRTYREPTLLFHNEGGKRFTDLSKSAGPDLLRPIVGRGLAVGDYDNDGRLDALVVDGEGAPLLLHNESPKVGNYLNLRLIGGKGSNRDAYGARVEVDAGGRRQVLICHADGSYFASCDPRVHVGLGKATSATITIRWPSGAQQTVRAEQVNRTINVTEAAR
jgi:hypothetical protein